MTLRQVLLLAAAFPLLAAGLLHSAQRADFVATLTSHGVFRRRHSAYVAAGAAAGELLAGVLGIVGAARNSTVLALPPAVAYLCLGLYTTFALRRGPHRDCGCGIGSAPLTDFSVMRLGLLAALALASYSSVNEELAPVLGIVLAATIGVVGTVWTGGWSHVSFLRDRLLAEHSIRTYQRLPTDLQGAP